MGGSLCTTISSNGHNSAETTMTRETTVTYSTISDTIETVACEFKILSEKSPNIFTVSAGCRVTDVILDELETSLAGVMLLTEYDGQYKRLWTWFWKYGLSGNVFNTLRLGGDAPGFPKLGRGYILTGCTPEITVHESVLGAKWSGRLLIQAYNERRAMFFEFLWHDIQKTFIHPLRCWCSRRC